MTAVEINFDGLIGPTHNYAGLSLGNIAATQNAGDVSQPRLAALQGLQKMRLLRSIGLPQGILLPHLRPNIDALYALGFRGSPEVMMASAWRADPALMRLAMSASAMWTANAATVSPSVDTADGKVHMTVANLATMFHRALEAPFTEKMLRLIFGNEQYFTIHSALPGGTHLGDEGAANHGRFAPRHGAPGVELFVYADKQGGRFPGRQSQRASAAVARRHGLDASRTLCVRQADAAIEAGAFHNDVVSVTNGDVLFTHAQAFETPDTAYTLLRTAYPSIQIIEVPSDTVPLHDAIHSYLFNSQLITCPDGTMALILPQEVANTPSTQRYIQDLITQDTPIKAAHIIDVRESMRNGGGPACLRLRVVLTSAEQAAMDPRFLLDDGKIAALEQWVSATYPEQIAPDDLGDPLLHRQCLAALDQLTALLGLGSLYAFQA